MKQSIIKRILKQKLSGNIGIISGITALTMAGVAMQMGYSGFKIKAEKQLHILNSIRFATIIQIGIEEGWVENPDTNNTILVTLSEIDSDYNLSSNLKNPSLATQMYDDDSYIKIKNINGKTKFYCNLIEDNSDHEYTDETIEVHTLSIQNIELNI